MNLLFITSNRIGDAVLSTGVLADVLDKHPGAAVTVACGPAAAGLFEGVPGLERLIVMKKAKLAGHWRSLWREVSGTPWDFAIDLRGSLITYFIRARRRLIYYTPKTDDHRVQQLAAAYGVSEPLSPKLWPLPQHKIAAQNYLAFEKAPLVVGPTANWIGKQWFGDRFAAVIKALTGSGGALAGHPVILMGGPGEAAEDVLTALSDHPVQNLIGQLDLLTAHEVLAQSRLYIGNDSGLMHVAAASGCPTLGLFGPSRQEHYGPWGASCACVQTAESYDAIVTDPNFYHRKPISWMGSLSVEAVLEAAETLLKRTEES